jgi:hypothetical protein
MSTSKEFQSLSARKEKERLPELVLTLGSITNACNFNE